MHAVKTCPWNSSQESVELPWNVNGLTVWILNSLVLTLSYTGESIISVTVSTRKESSLCNLTVPRCLKAECFPGKMWNLRSPNSCCPWTFCFSERNQKSTDTSCSQQNDILWPYWDRKRVVCIFVVQSAGPRWWGFCSSTHRMFVPTLTPFNPLHCSSAAK
jgi:hypothetical protein